MIELVGIFLPDFVTTQNKGLLNCWLQLEAVSLLVCQPGDGVVPPDPLRNEDQKYVDPLFYEPGRRLNKDGQRL